MRTVRIVVIVNQKGGCGKTTTAINLSGIFASMGKRTLLVDMDPQSHCAAGLAIPEQRIDLDIGDAMLSDTPVDPSRLLWRVGRDLDLAPSRMKLAGLEAARGGLASKPDKERRLSRTLQSLSDRYDVCCVDCSPSIGLLTYNALAAATEVLLPVETSFFSLQGAVRQANTIATLGKRLGVAAPYWVLPTIHDTESSMAKDLFEELQRRFGQRVIGTPIRRDLKLKEAASFGQPIIEYSPGSTGAEDYTALAEFMLDQWSKGQDLPAQPGEIETSPTTGDERSRRLVKPAPVSPSASPARGLPTEGTTPALSGGFSTQATTGTQTATKRSSRADEITELAKRLRDSALASAKTPTAAKPVDTPASGVAPARPHPVRVVTPDDTELAAFSPRRELVNGTLVRGKTEVKPLPSPTVFGARSTSRGVLFVQPLETGSDICIAGDFNAWSPTSHRMRRNEHAGVFELCVPMLPGRHAYRLVIDGSWVSDSHNPLHEPNEFSETNSVVDVA